MRKAISLFISISFFVGTLLAQEIKPVFINFNDFNNFNTAVLKGGIKKEAAIRKFDTLVKAIIYEEVTRNQIDLEKPSWVFPLQGYDYQAIGGKNGNGYYDKGYRYLDGNKHLAHPAHDIFIRDKNQDCIDDRTQQPVNVLAVDNGIVIACTNEWDTASNLRGGKYIWIYHLNGIITYYAHNRTIFVKPGDRVKQGEKIAEVGRTGYNAYKKRSPTHLHFSAFHLVDGLPVPYNPYKQLIKAVSL